MRRRGSKSMIHEARETRVDRHVEKVKKMRSGGMTGSYRRVADGIASKGKTKGKMVKMNSGGYC